MLGDREEVEDAFQATFLILVRRGRSIGNRDSLASWLHGVAHRVSLRAGPSASVVNVAKDVML